MSLQLWAADTRSPLPQTFLSIFFCDIWWGQIFVWLVFSHIGSWITCSLSSVSPDSSSLSWFGSKYAFVCWPSAGLSCRWAQVGSCLVILRITSMHTSAQGMIWPQSLQQMITDLQFNGFWGLSKPHARSGEAAFYYFGPLITEREVGNLDWDNFLLFADRDRGFPGSCVCVWEKDKERTGSAAPFGSIMRKGLVDWLITWSWMFSELMTLHKCLTIRGSPENSQTSSSYMSEIVKVKNYLQLRLGASVICYIKNSENFSLTQIILDNEATFFSLFAIEKKNNNFSLGV